MDERYRRARHKNRAVADVLDGITWKNEDSPFLRTVAGNVPKHVRRRIFSLDGLSGCGRCRNGGVAFNLSERGDSLGNDISRRVLIFLRVT